MIRQEIMNFSSHSPEILSQPVAWIAIPGGKVKVISIDSKEGRENYIPQGTAQIFEVSPFEIAKYPVTNTQFTPFIEESGYSQRKWWTEEGWREKQQNQWVEPLFWRDSKWNGANYPLVGVSWYEALAFCHWLSDRTLKRIGLPTEQQWQRAAQGDTDWHYAWGESFEEDRCNWDTEGTTPVTQYEGKGDSTFGVVDMNGNVWEWCLTKFETGENELDGVGSRIVRGGAWALLYSHEIILGSTDRLNILPSERRTDVGFRCVRS
ncbi:MAG: SUMF1/EgtB/PvdO family nonheme iron enzyme [Chloroflexota bacterium]